MKISKETTAAIYTLKLGIEEAQFLQDLLFQVGGSPTQSRRYFADKLQRTFETVGVFCEHRAADVVRSLNNSVYFADTGEFTDTEKGA